MPSAITASTPALSILFARATDATTGITLAPILLNFSIYLPGLPAPVVITLTSCLTTTSTTSSTKGERSIILTPNGFLVISFAFTISLSTQSAGALPAAIIPSPPASDTAEASSASATHAIPPCIMGYFISNNSQISVLIISYHLTTEADQVKLAPKLFNKTISPSLIFPAL